MPIDVKRAYFYAPATRPIFIAIPKEDWEDGDEENVAQLNLSLYGTRDAAMNWAATFTSFMENNRFITRKCSPCNFRHCERDLVVTVHGDDFTLLGWQKDLDGFWKTIKAKYECKHRGRLGPSDEDSKQIRILNRIIEWTPEGLAYEGDQRHVEICFREVGIEENSRVVNTPTDKSINDPKNSNKLE